MRLQSASAAISLALLLTLLGCHTMRFEVGEGQPGEVVHDRKAFWLFGLVSTKNIDVTAICPSGALAIEEETSFVDGLFSFLTLSIYTPRSSTYYCAAEVQ
jgi:hypothetical protein